MLNWLIPAFHRDSARSGVSIAPCVIIVMYSTPAEGEEPLPRVAVPRPVGVAIALTVAFTLLAGLLPGPVIDFARHATLIF